MTEAHRTQAYGQVADPTLVDRFGVWLSARRIRKYVPSFAGKRVADLGCGYEASFSRSILAEAREIILADVAIADDLRVHPKVRAHVGKLPDAIGGIETRSVDVVLLVSVLEHLWRPLDALREVRRILADGGVFLVNVPSWRGKKYLELSAFQLGLSPANEMDDHKMYYDVEDLWPLLVQAGFLPSEIRCFSHKFGLNTFAACRVRARENATEA